MSKPFTVEMAKIVAQVERERIIKLIEGWIVDFQIIGKPGKAKLLKSLIQNIEEL